jgi:hypothetical protein
MEENKLVALLEDIANAIRYVKDTTNLINPQNFARLIREFRFYAVGEILDDNTIKLLSSMLKNGTYTLRYEDVGGNIIENFQDITTLTITNTDATYSDFINVNIPPYLAESIGVYDVTNERIGSIPLEFFKPAFGERLYRFGLLSDVHDYEGSVAEPSDDFRRALKLFNDKEDVEMTCICGDISENGTTAEFQMYAQDVVAQSPDTPVYTTTGNHDCPQGGSPINYVQWEAYTGHSLTFEVNRPLDNGTVDHFLFLGMSRWNFSQPYEATSLNWLEDKLKNYKNERCFIFTHLFFPDCAGNFKEIYPSYNWLSGSQLTKLEEMRDKFKNTIWFSGHSHWKWYLQKFEDTANVCRKYNNDNKPDSGWTVHVPSCACPIDSDGITSRVSKPLESEGAVVDVYENYVDIRGIDLKNNLYLPIATYRLDTTIIPIGSTEDGKDDVEIDPSRSGQFTKNPFTHTNNTDTYPSVSYNANTDTYTMTFSTDGQKLIFEHPLLTNEVTPNDISISCDSVRYLRDGVEIEISDSDKKGIGFYRNDGYYGINVPFGEIAYPTIYTDDGGFTRYHLQFNSSSSKYKGDYPITIEIKGLRLVISTDSGSEGGSSTIGKYLKASDFTQNETKNPCTVTDSDEEGYVDLTFTQKSSGFFVKSESFTESSTSCQLVIDDVTIKTNGTTVSSINKCGFYTTDSQYTLSDGALLQVSSDGVQFNTSSSCTGPYPIVIHLKAKLLFS